MLPLRTWVTEDGEVKCKGGKIDYQNKHYEDLVISHQIAITLVEDWDSPTELEKCLYFESRHTKGTVVTSEARNSTYMSTDGSMVRCS
jgi:hypothetical protein